MVRRILTSLAAPVRGLHQAAYVLAGLTLASQILALLRDRLFAHTFGASELLDLYYAAFKVPDLVFALIASLVSAYVLIPRIAGAGKHNTRELLSETVSFLCIAGGGLTLLLAIFAPSFLFVFFPNAATSSHAGEFVFLARLLLLQPILLGLSGIVTSVTQVERKFVLFALSPVLYNLGIIGGALFLYPILGLPGIGIGVVIGACLHVSIHIPVLVGAKVLPRPVIPHPRLLMGVMKDSIPRSLALAMGSITTLLLTMLAARAGEGAISVFTLASNLEGVPLSLIGASYATAAFPVLAESMEAKKYDAFRATLTAAARHIIFWSAIVSVLTLVLRAQIVRVILGSGAFDWNATRLTAAILALLVVALIAQGLVLLASRAFYAAQKSWNPLIIQAIGAVVSVAFAWGSLRLSVSVPEFRYFIEALMRVDDIPGVGVLFIALGASIGQMTTGVLAFCTLKTVAPGVAGSLMRPLFEGLGAAILGGAASYGVLTFTAVTLKATTLPIIFTEGAIAGMVGITVAGAVLALLANQEFMDLVDSLKRMKPGKALTPSGPVLSDRSDA